MAEVVVAPIGDDIWKRLVAAIGKQFGYTYLIHYNKNIMDLDRQDKNMECQINDMQVSIQAAENNIEEIRDEVRNWMTRVDSGRLEAKTILDDANANKRCFFGCCPNLIWRHQLSRKANKEVITLKQLEEEKGKFHIISKAALPSRLEEFMASGDFVNFETTRLAMEKVMEELKEDKINFIGIHGMGSAGKTTLVEEIGRKAEKAKLFDNECYSLASPCQHFY